MNRGQGQHHGGGSNSAGQPGFPSGRPAGVDRVFVAGHVAELGYKFDGGLDYVRRGRIAGLGPANMGDTELPAIQTEQSITVSGYGAMTVNNEPASIPADYPAFCTVGSARIRRLFGCRLRGAAATVLCSRPPLKS